MTTEGMVEDTLREGFEHYRKQFASLIIATGIAAFGSIFIITAPPLFFGLYLMTLRIIKGEEVEFTNVFSGFDYLLTSWALFLLGFAAIILGCLALIVPGLLLYVLFQYSVPYALMDGKGAIDALKKSADVAWNNLLFTVVLTIILAAINSAGGAVAFGWFITYPYTILATTIAAQKLGGLKNGA